MAAYKKVEHVARMDVSTIDAPQVRLNYGNLLGSASSD